MPSKTPKEGIPAGLWSRAKKASPSSRLERMRRVLLAGDPNRRPQLWDRNLSLSVALRSDVSVECSSPTDRWEVWLTLVPGGSWGCAVPFRNWYLMSPGRQ